VDCAAGTSQSLSGQTSCDDCPPGFDSPPGSAECTVIDTQPVISLAANAAVDEAGFLSVPLSITDADGDNLVVTISTDSNEPELLDTGNSGTQVDPYPTTADGFFSETSIVNNPGSYTSSLDFSPVFGDGGGADGDGSGSYTVTVQVQDDDGNIITQDLSLIVNDIPQPIPASGTTLIEAESYDNQNTIGVEVNPGGVVNIGFTQNGDIAQYQIDVAQAGLYDFVFQVAKQE
jgi:hypothetical protein